MNVTSRSIFSKTRIRRTSLIRRLWLPAVLILVSSVFLLVTALAFQQRLEKLREGRTDNSGWIVSQMEVDFLKLLIALDQAVIFGAGSGVSILPDEVERAIHRDFDIFYSRVTVFLATVERLPITAGLQAQLAKLDEARIQLAAKIDATPVMTAPDVDAMLEFTSAFRPLVRDATVAAVQEVSNEDARISNQEAQLFQRFYLQTLLLFSLLAYGSFLVSRLWRQLDARTYDASRTAAILSHAFDSTLNAVVVISDTGRLLYFNAIARDLFSLQDAHLGWADVQSLLRFSDQSGQDADLALGEASAAALSGKGARIGYCLRAEGGPLPVELSVVSDTDVSGENIFVYFIRDISAQVSAEQELRHAVIVAEKAAQAKGRFLATMSHEMRTPLHGLMASLALIDDAKLDPDNKALINTARGCSVRAQMQVDDVLELTKISDSVEDLQPFAVVQVVTDIVNELRPLSRAAGNRIVLVTDGPFDDFSILGQTMAFSRTLYNLIGNAIKFTNEGVITVKLTLTDQGTPDLRLTVEVEDTGVGIAEQDLDRIFDYFETLARTGPRPIVGSGLGLPIAKLAVSQMGGELRVASTQNVGSRFFFTIPLQQAGAHRPVMLKPDTPKMVQNPPSAKHVLVVDDNEVNVTLMCQMVRRLGHSCEFAQNGQDAVEKANAARFDVILMDFSMPVMDGPTAARRIRSDQGLSASAVIIGVTALIIPHIQQAELRAFDTVLTKPVGMALLQETIAQTQPLASGMTTKVAPTPVIDAETDDPRKAFADLSEMVGPDMARRLILAGLDDADAAVIAIDDTTLDLDEKADVIHKAVGSTAFIGMTELSQTLSEAETLARNNRDPAASNLATMARRLLLELRAVYTGLQVITPHQPS